VDGGLGLRMAIEHLLALEHRKIAALAWPEDSRVGNNRMEGYHEAMDAAGIDVLPEWVKRGEGSYTVGFQTTNELLDLPEDIRPTAIVAMNDLMAIGAIAAIRQRGLRPGKDLAVTGFDDTPSGRYLTPPLTSLRQPISLIGKNLMERLITYLETGEYPEPFADLVAPELVVRESTTGIKEPPILY
jgi:DNA-binding LacI/PurR family transcriptional regulator